MATVYKRTRKKPIPKAAEIVEARGRRYAVWTSRGKRKRRAPLTDDGRAVEIEDPGYTVEWYAWNGPRRRLCGGPDKDAAEALGARMEALEMQRRRGLIDPAAERFAAEGRRPILGHLTDFRAALEARGNTPQHCEETYSQARKVIELCGVEAPADLTASAVQGALGTLRGEGRSLDTCNHYLRSVKGFSRWLHRDNRTRRDALVSLKAYNAATDPRHVRRELQPEETIWLVRTAEDRTLPEHKISGLDRAMVYRLALGTGFRAKELRKLTPESFDLEADPPTVTVQAVCSKRRREDCQPIPRHLAEALGPWLAGREAGRPVFPALPVKTARMLRADLKAARTAWIAAAPSDAEREARERSDFLVYQDAAGRVADFHATRHTYVSAIVAGGASVKTAQELARHSTPALTTGRYSHARLHDLTGALEALPNLTPDGGHGKTSVCELRKTGTDDLPGGPSGASGKDLGAANGRAVGGAVTRLNMTESAEDGGRDLESQPEGDGPQLLALPGNRTSRRPLAGAGLKYPLAESNRCSRTENPMSWATRRRGPGR